MTGWSRHARGWARTLRTRPPSPTALPISSVSPAETPKELPMSDWTDLIPEAARDYIEGRKPDEVECIVPDLAGVARGKAMPASKFAKQEKFYLPDSIFLQTITGDWAERPGTSFTEPDMVMRPDFSTASAAPWTADVTLQVIHDV